MANEPTEFYASDAIQKIADDLAGGVPNSPVTSIAEGKDEPPRNAAASSRIIMYLADDSFGPAIMVGGDERSVQTRYAGIIAEIHAIAPEGPKATPLQHLRQAERILHRLVLAVHRTNYGRYKVISAKWQQGIKHKEYGATVHVTIARALDVLDIKYTPVDNTGADLALFVEVQKGTGGDGGS